MIDRWLSASDLAEFGRLGVGVPSTPRGCAIKATREKWPSMQVPGKGGKGGVKTVFRPPDAILAAIGSIGDATRHEAAQGKATPSDIKPVPPAMARYHMHVSEPASDKGFGEISPALLNNCLRACQMVHGDDFKARQALDQMAYAVDLYNLAVRMTRQAGKSPTDALRLEITGLAEQLRLFLKMGWARRFPPFESAVL